MGDGGCHPHLQHKYCDGTDRGVTKDKPHPYLSQRVTAPTTWWLPCATILRTTARGYGVETPHRKGKATLPVVVPMIIKGLCETHPAMKPYGLESFMTQQLLDTGILDWIDSKEYTTGDISELWYHQLQNGVSGDGFNYTPEQMAELFESPSWGKVWGKMDKFFNLRIYVGCQ